MTGPPLMTLGTTSMSGTGMGGMGGHHGTMMEGGPVLDDNLEMFSGINSNQPYAMNTNHHKYFET